MEWNRWDNLHSICLSFSSEPRMVPLHENICSLYGSKFFHIRVPSKIHPWKGLEEIIPAGPFHVLHYVLLKMNSMKKYVHVKICSYIIVRLVFHHFEICVIYLFLMKSEKNMMNLTLYFVLIYTPLASVGLGLGRILLTGHTHSTNNLSRPPTLLSVFRLFC